MTDDEFDKWIKSIMSMCLDMLQRNLTRETFISNLESYVKGLKDNV